MLQWLVVMLPDAVDSVGMLLCCWGPLLTRRLLLELIDMRKVARSRSSCSAISSANKGKRDRKLVKRSYPIRPIPIVTMKHHKTARNSEM